jgi:hypothetical protein
MSWDNLPQRNRRVAVINSLSTGALVALSTAGSFGA